MRPGRKVIDVALTLLCLVCGSYTQTAKTGPRIGTRFNASDEAVFQKAVKEYESGNIDKAQVELRRLVATYPSNANVQALEGMLLVEQGKIDGAIPFLAKAHRLSPSNDTIAANLGLAYLKLGRAQDAVEPLKSACRLASSSFADHLALAQALLSLQRFQEAASVYEQSSKLTWTEEDISPTEFHAQWAQALIGAEKPEEALKILHADSALASDDGLQSALGEAEEKRGHYEASFEAYKRAAQLAPTESNIDAYGAELLRHWAFPAAIEIYRFGVQRYPNSQRMKIGLGTSFFGNNDFADAAPVFQDLLKQNPNDRQMADMLGRSCSAELAGNSPSCDGLVQFAKDHPDNSSVALYAAITLMHRPEAEASANDAEGLLRSALKADPNSAEAWYQLGCLQQMRAQWSASATSLEKAISVRPSFSEAHYRLARAYARLGRKEESQQQIALQQRYSEEAKDADRQRMKDVITFITNNH